MAWTAPRTWVAGEIVTAALMNTHVRDDLRYLKGLDGAVAIEDDLTVDNLITSGNVDGVDVSAHKAGTATAQHTAGVGDHTHQTAGAAGGKIDHGAALDGLSDDDHTQYQLKSLLTTQGDIPYATGASTWARLAKGTAYQVLRMNSGATAPEWANMSMTLHADLANAAYEGIITAGTAGAALAVGDLCYLQTADSRWELADADAEATAKLMLGICVQAATGDGEATTMLLYGTVRADAAFPTMTVGAPVFVSTTAGDIQTAAPSGTTDIIRIVGYGYTADELFFCPSPDFFEHI